MFWPKYRTDSSRSLSSRIASSIAAMYGSSRAMCELLGVDIVDGVLDRRERALQAERDGRLHLVARRLGEPVRLLRAQRPVGDEPCAEARYGVAALRSLVLLLRPEDGNRLVLGEVQRHARRRDDVAVGGQPVRPRREKGRAVA